MTPAITVRKAFVDALFEFAKKDRNIITIASDSRGSVGLEKFVEELPDQFIDVGIAEQNAVGIAAGLAKSGKKVFVCGPSCFQTARASEQVKVDIAYCQSNVKVIGVSGGISYGALGSSHHSVHDIALIRTMPGMKVVLPSDNFQARKLAEALVNYVGPVYVRFGKDPAPDVYENDSCPFEIGKANVVIEGSKITIIGIGETVRIALDAGLILEKKGIKAKVIDLHTIKPMDTETVIQAARETGGIITVEDHSIYGGLGGVVSEVIAQNCPVPMKIMGIPDEPAITGTKVEAFQHYGLTAENIAQIAMRMIENRV